jgi:hypothetical protein
MQRLISGCRGCFPEVRFEHESRLAHASSRENSITVALWISRCACGAWPIAAQYMRFMCKRERSAALFLQITNDLPVGSSTQERAASS